MVNRLIICVFLMLAFAGAERLAAQTGCPSIDALTLDGQDALTIDCDQPCATIEAEVFETGSTDEYVVESVPFDPPYPFNDGTSLFIGIDDTWSGAIDLPFEFCFFGINYDQIVLGSNGVITFDAGEANGYCPWAFNETAPDPGLPTNAIFGVYYDINPATCGAVRYEILGEEPCRTFVVNYDGVCHFSCSSLQTTTQIVFYETTNAIDIYIDDKPTCSGWNGGSSLLGIQNNTGTVAYVPPGRNTGAWTANSEAWRFTPSGGAPSYTVTWFEDGNEIGTGDSIEVCPSETTTYTATAVYDGCGGSSIEVTDDFTITVDYNVDELPDPTITNPVTDLCISDVNYQVEVLEDGGTFSSNCIGCIGADGMFDVLGAGAGTYDIIYTQASDCGDITDQFTVNVIMDADASITSVDPLCTSAAAINMVGANPGGTWTTEDCADCLTADGTFDPALANPGNVDVTYTIDGICPDNDQFTVEVVSQDDATVIMPAFICENGGEALIPAVQAGGDWSADCNDCIDQNGNFDPLVSGPGIFTIEYGFDTFCPDNSVQTLEVVAVTEPEINPVNDLCTSSDPVALVANAEGGAWSADCGNCLNGQGSFDPSIGAGDFTVTYMIDGLCPVSTTESVTVLDQQDATITAVDTLCTAGAVEFLTAVDPNGTWTADCVGCIDPVSGAFDPSSVFPGDYTVTYTITGLCGDASSETINVDFSDDATMIPPTDYCLGWGDVQIDSNQDGGHWTATCGDCIHAASGVFNTEVAGVGTHTITYNFSGLCGAQDQTEITITPNDDSTIQEEFGFCIDAGGQQLVAATPGGFWTASCDNCVTAQGLFSPSIAGIGTHTVTYSIPGPCGTESTEDIEIFPLPVPTFSALETSGCAPFTAGFVQDSLQNVTCQWDFGDGTFGTDCGFTAHTYNNPGCYDVGLTMTSFEGCVNSVQYNNIVCGLDHPEAAYIYSPANPTTDDPIISLEEMAIGEVSYEWTIDGMVLSNEDDFEYNLLDAGTNIVDLCLTAIDENGCIDVFCRNIEMIEKLRVYVPNAFTPDGDGVNEVWLPSVIGAVEYQVIVFDRWGDIVFQSNTVGEPWLGNRQQGEYFVPDGLYYYLLTAVGQDLETVEYSGYVIILR
ncbi:MAG: gliding motility-associated C-terminal domain-containing protein [Flavobacteriales bacterium]|nr:gliding motility-associated C-terminal domain-containing protein [Flavobacteriales bacterium]